MNGCLPSLYKRRKLTTILSFIIHRSALWFVGVSASDNYDYKEVKKVKDLHVVCFSFEWTRTTPAMEQDGWGQATKWQHYSKLRILDLFLWSGGVFLRSSCNMPILGMNAQNWYFALVFVVSKISTLELGNRMSICRESIGTIDEKDERL